MQPDPINNGILAVSDPLLSNAQCKTKVAILLGCNRLGDGKTEDKIRNVVTNDLLITYQAGNRRHKRAIDPLSVVFFFLKFLLDFFFHLHLH
jgi:hypothetical protein